MSNAVECLECAALIAIASDAMENELIACADCGTEFEILSLNPPGIDYAPEVEEDWGE